MQDHTSPAALENAIALQKYGVGQPVRRKEDDTLVRGKGRYTDDFNLPSQAYAWIVRSSHAHGTIRGIDISAARAEDIRRALKSGVTPTFTKIRRSNATRLRAPTPKANSRRPG